MLSFKVQKFKIPMKLNLFFVFGVLSKKPLPNSRSPKSTPLFSSNSIVSALIFKPSIHFDFIFVCGGW